MGSDRLNMPHYPQESDFCQSVDPSVLELPVADWIRDYNVTRS